MDYYFKTQIQKSIEEAEKRITYRMKALENKIDILIDLEKVKPMADRDQIEFNNLESFEYLTENLPDGDIKYYRQTVRINPHDSLQYPRDVFSKSIMDTVEITKEEYENMVSKNTNKHT